MVGPKPGAPAEDSYGYDPEFHAVPLPPGQATIHHVAFEDAGKQYVYACGPSPFLCAFQVPAVSGLNSGQTTSSRTHAESLQSRNAVTGVELVGVTSLTPRTGLLVQGFPEMSLVGPKCI